MKVRIDYATRAVTITDAPAVFQHSHNIDTVEVQIDRRVAGEIYKLNVTDASGTRNISKFMTYAGAVGDLHYYRAKLSHQNTAYEGDITLNFQILTTTVVEGVTKIAVRWTSEAFAQTISAAPLDESADIDNEETSVIEEIYAAIALKQNIAHKGFYKASDLGIGGSMTTLQYIDAVLLALTDNGGDFLFDGIANIVNDAATLSDAQQSQTILTLSTDDSTASGIAFGQIVSMNTTPTTAHWYGIYYDSKFSGWIRFATSTDLANILDGTTPISNLDVAGNAIVRGNLTVIGDSNLATLTISGDNMDMNDNKIINLADGANPKDAVNVSQLGTKANLTGGNTITGEQNFIKTTGDRYRVHINELEGTASIYDQTDDTAIAKFDRLGIWLNPSYITSVTGNYTPTKTMVDGYISTHNSAETAHSYLLGLIDALESDIARLDGRGKSFGEIAKTTAELEAYASAALRDAAINALIIAGFGGAAYTPTSGDLVYDTGVGDGERYHEWEYNGTNWVDNGEFTNAKATNSIWGLIKGDSTYLSIVNGIATVLLANNATNLKDSGSANFYTYTSIYDALARLTTAETDINTLEDVTIPALDNRVTENESDIAALQSNLASVNLVNAKEIYSRQQPYAALTKASPTADDANKMAYLNELTIHGQTVKNLVKNGNFAQGTANWTAVQASLTATNGMLNIIGSGSSDYTMSYQDCQNTPINGDKVFVKLSFMVTNSLATSFQLVADGASAGTDQTNTTNTPTINTWYDLAVVFTMPSDVSGLLRVKLLTNYASTANATNAVTRIKNVQVINLTTLGTHPTLGVAWSTLTANQLASYIGNLSVDGTTMGLHSFTPKEVHANTATPNKAEVKVLRGRTVKESLVNPDFNTALSASDWVATDCGTPTVGSSKITFTASAQNGGIAQTLTVVSGNKWYIAALVKASSNNVKLVGTNPTASAAHSGGGAFELLHFIVTATSTSIAVSLIDESASAWASVECYFIQAFPLTGLGLAHLTTVSEVAAHFNISTATTTSYAFGITHSKPTALAVYNSANALQRTYTIPTNEWPTDQQTYGMATLPNGYGDYIKGGTYWRNVGHVNLNGTTESTWAQNASGTNTYYYQLPSWISNSIVAIADTTTALSNRFVQANITSTDTEGFMLNGNTILVRILKTKVDAMSGANTLAKFLAWLTANNVYIAYLRTNTEHDLTTFPTRITAVATDYTSITGALNPLTACELFDRYTAFTTLSGVGELRSLPDGKDDVLASYVDDTTDSTTFNQRITKITRVTEKIALPTSAVTDGWAVGTVGATNTSFVLDLNDFKTAGVSLVLPANTTTIANAHTSSVYPLSAWDSVGGSEELTTAGISINNSGYIAIVLPNTTADTLAELYTYLVANPLVVVIERTEATETPTIPYIQQSDLAMTLVVQSSTLSKESDFDARYCRDLTHIIDGLLP